MRIRSRTVDTAKYLAFLLPAVVLYTTFTIVPLVMCIRNSFTDYSATSTGAFVGLENYIAAFRDPLIVQGFGFTVLYTAVTTLFITLFALALAIVFSRSFYTGGFVRAAFYFPSCVALMAIGYAWRYLLSSDSDGLVNMILNKVGFPSVLWLSDPTAARLAVIIVAIWIDLGWCATLFYAYIQSIPPELYEAARLDGATVFQQSRHITVPMIMPSIVINLTVLLAQGLRVYELPQALTKGGPATATNTITHALLTRGVTEWKFGRASAIGVIILVMTTVLCMIQMKLLERKGGGGS